MNAPESAPLNVVVVEDSELDYELLLALLMREGLQPRTTRVEDEAGLRSALAHGADAVITDHNLPRFDSFASLQVAKSIDADIPVIVLSGEMSEELAVASLHAGADDFVLKTRMFRIAAALQRSLEAAQARRDARRAMAALAESERKLHALTQHLERAKEDERRAIAQEIHDDIGGALTALKFEIVRLGRDVGGHPDVRARLDAIHHLLESAVVASHRIQHALRPAVLDAGLVAALEWLARGFSERTGIAVDFESNREEFELSPDRAAALYRVAQEALTNIRKHAGAHRVQMQLFSLGDQVTLEVADNGAGFETDSLQITPGFGVRGMLERARGLGGWAEVSSSPGRGTTVMFSIPPEAQRADSEGLNAQP